MFLPKKPRLEEEMEDIKQIMAVKPNKKLSRNTSKRQLVKTSKACYESA